MLKIRYSRKTGLLSGWTDREAESRTLQADEVQDVALVDIPKPLSADYEYFIFSGGNLKPSGKQEPMITRDLAAEIDALKARIEKLETR